MYIKIKFIQTKKYDMKKLFKFFWKKNLSNDKYVKRNFPEEQSKKDDDSMDLDNNESHQNNKYA